MQLYQRLHVWFHGEKFKIMAAENVFDCFNIVITTNEISGILVGK